MLGLILVYFIGKKFFQLAEKYEKNKWGLAAGGVVTYYGVAILCGAMVGIAVELWTDMSIIEIGDFVLGLIAMPFGILAAYLVYMYLKKRFEKNANLTTDSIDDIGSM